MSRIAFGNIIFGFTVIFFAAIYGAVMAFDSADTMARAPMEMLSWGNTLVKSSHGHTNLFGLLHICFGLTFAFSALPKKWQILQSFFLGCGTFAMGPLMIARAKSGLPKVGIDFLGGFIGLFLSLALAAILMHIVGLGIRSFKHSV